MVVLAPLLAHLGALGRHLGFNLVHLGAKLGAKRHLTGLSQKSFLKVFAGMASRTLPKIIQEAGGFRLGCFPLCFTSIFASGASQKTIKKQDGSRDPKMIPKRYQNGPKVVHFCDPLGLMLTLLGFMLVQVCALWLHLVAKLRQDVAKMVQHSLT